MITETDAADWLTLAAAWRLDKGLPADRETASAKAYASELRSLVERSKLPDIQPSQPPIFATAVRDGFD